MHMNETYSNITVVQTNKNSSFVALHFIQLLTSCRLVGGYVTGAFSERDFYILASM